MFWYATEDIPADDAWGWYEIDVNSIWSNPDSILEDIAEESAEDYFKNHDGWEDQWPLTFYIKGEANNILGAVNVYLDYDPIFTGSIVK